MPKIRKNSWIKTACPYYDVGDCLTLKTLFKLTGLHWMFKLVLENVVFLEYLKIV